MTHAEIDKLNIQKSWIETISIAKEMMLDICNQYSSSIHRITYTKEDICRKFTDSDYGLIVIFCNHEETALVKELSPLKRCKGVHWRPFMFDGKNSLIHLALSETSEIQTKECVNNYDHSILLHELIHFVDHRHSKTKNVGGMVNGINIENRENIRKLKDINEKYLNFPESILRYHISESYKTLLVKFYHKYGPETEFHAYAGYSIGNKKSFETFVEHINTYIDKFQECPYSVIGIIHYLMFIEASRYKVDEYKLPLFAEDICISNRIDDKNKSIKGLTEDEFNTFKVNVVKYLSENLEMFKYCVKTMSVL